MTINSTQAKSPQIFTKEIFVSVIVPFYNAHENIIECVESLLNQNFSKRSYEIILVDNASSDDGPALLEKFKDRITLIKEEKIGPSVARNRGIFSANGDILAFIDSDCVASKNWLKHMVNSFKLANAVAVAGEVKAYKPKTDVEIFYEGLMSQKKNLSYEHPYAVTANLAFLRSVSNEVSFDNRFSKAVAEDVDFCWRLLEKGYRIEYQPDALVYHKNVKTKWQLFKKIFLQGYHAPKVIKKNLKFLEREKRLRRVRANSYLKLLRDILCLIFSGKGKKSERILEITFMLARKSGLICGSIRFGFFYL
ncbi:glycosyltransferase [Acidobacteriota bacterium]